MSAKNMVGLSHDIKYSTDGAARAILTKYKANRSFQSTYNRKNFISLEYDAVASYTMDLFENFMEYKQLIKLVQDIITNPDNYTRESLKSLLVSLQAVNFFPRTNWQTKQHPACDKNACGCQGGFPSGNEQDSSSGKRRDPEHRR